MSEHHDHARTFSWPDWWAGYSALYKEAKAQTASLRHGLKVLRVSEFAAQFYCEHQLDLRLMLRGKRFEDWERRTASEDVEGRIDPLALGVRGHEKLAANDSDGPAEHIWRGVFDGDRVRLHDPLLLGKYEGIFLAGHPDVILFASRMPELVIEYKFSAKKIPSAQYHSQAGLYCYLLEGLGFDVNNLHYVLGIFPPMCQDGDGLRNATNFIVENFPFKKVSMDLSDGTAQFHGKRYNRASTIKELTWASEYWRGTRDAVPTKVDWKCRACSERQICKFSLADA